MTPYEIKVSYIDKKLKREIVKVMERRRDDLILEGKLKEADEVDMYMFIVEQAEEPPEE